MQALTYIVPFILGIALTVALVVIFKKKLFSGEPRRLDQLRAEYKRQSQDEVKDQKNRLDNELREEFINWKNEYNRKHNQKINKLNETEKRLLQKEENLDRRYNNLDAKEKDLNTKDTRLTEKQREVDASRKEAVADAPRDLFEAMKLVAETGSG